MKPSKDRSTARSSGEDERLEQWRQGEERRRAKRQSKEAKEERKRSKAKFRRQSKREALATARQEQPVLIETPKHDPLALQAGERVERFHGEFGARIDGPDGSLVVDSTLPLRSDVGNGPERLADYSLEDRGSLLSPDNPIVATEISRDVQGGLRIGEFGIRLQTASSATADAVEDRAFFANALPDTDYVVLPTATGAHMSLQVRSADAPEQAVLALDLPAGAQARLVGETETTDRDPGEAATLPRGSVEIVHDGEVIGSILAPVAWGADGEPLEVSYALSGSDLVVSFPHRSADVQYPLVIDPLAGDLFRVNEQGSPTSTSSFVIARSGGEPAAWTYGESVPGFPHGPGQGGTYDHNGALWVSNVDGNRFNYPDWAYGQWTWQAPRQSFIKRADFKNVYFTPTFQPYPAAMCLAEGVFSTAIWNWQSGYWIDAAAPNPPNGTSPWIGGPAPHGSCNTKTNNGKAHWIDNPHPGNISVFRLFAYGAGYRYYYSDAALYGAAVYLDDNDLPRVTSATSSPGGWVRSGTLTTRVNSTDPGLGVIVHAIDIPIEGATPTGRRVQFTGRCDRGRISRCPEDFDHTFSYNTEDVLPDDPNYPATLGPQRAREGIHTIQGDTYDATWKSTHFNAGTIKIDRTPPNGTISGIGEGELARDRDYQISATSTDPLSGSRSVQITLDGNHKASRDDCPANANPCTLTWTLDGGDPALTEGTHTLRVNTTDQVGNTQTAATRTFKVERTKPTAEFDGSLLPTDEGWVARGEQDLVIDASDPPSSFPATGVTSIEARIDGEPIEPAVQQACDAGGCELSADLRKNTDALAEGQHTLTIMVEDGAGNTAAIPPVEFSLDRDAPSLTLDGDLTALPGQELQRGQTYSLSITADDDAGAARSGLGSVGVEVDDKGLDDVVEQPCVGGGCRLERTFQYVVDDYEAGPHTITVTGTDLAGNETTETLEVDNADPPAPGCPVSPPVPEAGLVPPLSPTLAQELLRASLPEALDRWSPIDLDGTVIQPTLTAGDAQSFGVAGTLNYSSVDKQALDGATLTVRTDYVPICVAPSTVGPAPSSPEGPINDTAVLYANSAPATDTLFRPTVTGAMALSQLRSVDAPTLLSWNVGLQPGQELRSLPDGSAAIIESVSDGEIETIRQISPAAPSADEQRRSLNDTPLQLRLAGDALARAVDAVPDEIVAVVPKPWARDSAGRPVATNLTVSGSTLTMAVDHRQAAPAYPVIATNETIVANSLDEWEAQKAVAATASYTDEDVEAAQPPPPTAGAPLSDPAGSALGVDDEGLNDPSAAQPADPNDDQAEVQAAEPDAAASGAPNLPDIGITESHPAVLYSPDRAALQPEFNRPVVPWRVVQMLEAPNPRVSVDRQNSERNRARLWSDPRQAPPGQPAGRLAGNGWYQVANSPDRGRRAPGETNVIPTDVAFQFAQARSSSGAKDPNGQTITYRERRSPTLADYSAALDSFLTKYPGATRNFFPWNEPQLEGRETGNPTRNDPIRAARYWAIANALCHPEGQPMRCQGDVVAGEFAGYGRDRTFRRSYRAANGETVTVSGSYDRAYQSYVGGGVAYGVLGYPTGAPPARVEKPKVWGFHAYNDIDRRQLRLKNSQRLPITRKYYNRFYRDPYFRRDPNAENTRPEVWITAIGSRYHRRCDTFGPKLKDPRRGLCSDSGQTRLIFGKRNQSDGLKFYLRELDRRFKGVGRLYYYHVHNTPNAMAFYNGPKEVRGRCCPPEDWGLIGSAKDDESRGLPAFDKEGRGDNPETSSDYSHDNEARLAFCTLRDGVIKPLRPKSCSVPPDRATDPVP